MTDTAIRSHIGQFARAGSAQHLRAALRRYQDAKAAGQHHGKLADYRAHLAQYGVAKQDRRGTSAAEMRAEFEELPGQIDAAMRKADPIEALSAIRPVQVAGGSGQAATRS